MDKESVSAVISDPGGLFARAQAGDEAAWSELFHHCYPKVRRAIDRRLNSRRGRAAYDASDIASDLFKSLAAKRERFQFEDVNQVTEFLIGAAKQKLVDQQRRDLTLKRDKRRERPLSAGEDGGGDWLPSSDPTPSQHAVAREAAEMLLDAGSPEARRAIELALEGHSSQAIADQTGWHIRKVQRFFAERWNAYWGRI